MKQLFFGWISKKNKETISKISSTRHPTRQKTPLHYSDLLYFHPLFESTRSENAQINTPVLSKFNHLTNSPPRRRALLKSVSRESIAKHQVLHLATWADYCVLVPGVVLVESRPAADYFYVAEGLHAVVYCWPNYGVKETGLGPELTS